ncbi:plasma membrane fusion protein Prm1p [Trichomonascus vanleenenianus]|uniref:plasma membrane fusion protein Prm1p n=1 Tax=Trichomonascus vanleenenianus TaxID=2268995 RepID=UPI003ECACA20
MARIMPEGLKAAKRRANAPIPVGMPNLWTRLKARPRENVVSYIGIRARLSQVWLNYWTILLSLMAVKVLLFRSSLANSLNSAERYTLKTCELSEKLVSQAASTPHYVSAAANSLIEEAMTAALKAMVDILLLIIKAAENIIIFVIEMVIGTYACLLTATVNGAVSVAINATEAIIDFVNDGLGAIADELEVGLGALSTAVNSVEGFIADVSSLFTGTDNKISFKQVNLTVGELKDFKIPDSVNDRLTYVRDHLPTYDDVKNETEGLIRKPFEILSGLLNDTLSRDLNLDLDLISVPPKQSLSYCNNGFSIHGFYTALQDGTQVATKYIAIALFLVALLAMFPVVYKEIRNWRWMQVCATKTAEAGYEQQIEIIHDSTHRHIAMLQNFVSKSTESPLKKTLTKWWVGYVTYTPALATIFLGLGGLVLVALQYVVLHQVNKSLPEWQDSIADVTNDVSTEIKNESIAWVNNINKAISHTEATVNNELFGWIHQATDSVNHTLTAFMLGMNKELKLVFQSTPLYDPISTVVYCTIGSKIAMAQKGLTWIHDHSDVTFPRIPAQAVLNNQSFINDSIGDEVAESAIDALHSVINVYQHSLQVELFIAMVLTLCWLIIAINGLFYCWWKYYQLKPSEALATFPRHPSDKIEALNSLSHARPFSSVKVPIRTEFIPPSVLVSEPRTPITLRYEGMGLRETVFDMRGGEECKIQLTEPLNVRRSVKAEFDPNVNGLD